VDDISSCDMIIQQLVVIQMLILGAHWDTGNTAHTGQSTASSCDSHICICQRELRGRAGSGQGRAAQFYVCFSLRHAVFLTQFTDAAHTGQNSAGFCDSHVWIYQCKLRGKAGEHSVEFSHCSLRKTTRNLFFNVRSHCVTQCFLCCISLPCPASACISMSVQPKEFPGSCRS
jgi:hypothetical protein